MFFLQASQFFFGGLFFTLSKEDEKLDPVVFTWLPRGQEVGLVLIHLIFCSFSCLLLSSCLFAAPFVVSLLHFFLLFTHVFMFMQRHVL